MKYAVVVCDDDPVQAEEIAEMAKNAQMYLSDEDPVEFDFKIIGHSYDEVANYLGNNHLNGAFYFLDIELSDSAHAKTGLDLAELAKKQDPRAQIIFVTTHEELSLMTFQRRIGPIDYIIKDYSVAMQKRITATLQLAIKNLSEWNLVKKMTFSYRLGHLIKNINVDDVYYLETSQLPHKLHLVKSDGEADFVGNIRKVEKNNSFLAKISRSCLVNPKNIQTIDLHKKVVIFPNGDVVPYARSQAEKMRSLIEQQNRKE